MMDCQEKIKLPGLAILVDCWKHLDGPEYKQLWENILNSLLKYNIQTVVLATHEYNIKTHWNTDWFENTHHIFFNGNLNRNKWVESLPVAIGTAPSYIFETADTILNAKLPGKLKLMLHDSKQLEWYLLNIVPHIKNVWYFGVHWNICIKNRNIGTDKLINFFNQNNINCLTDINCTLTEMHQYPTNEELRSWQCIDQNVYQLVA